VKIATFNIYNVNRRLPNLLAWRREAKPEVVCLQELKATDADFPARAVGKGKAHRPYEFGVKVWVATPLRRQGRSVRGPCRGAARQPV